MCVCRVNIHDVCLTFVMQHVNSTTLYNLTMTPHNSQVRAMLTPFINHPAVMAMSISTFFNWKSLSLLQVWSTCIMLLSTFHSLANFCLCRRVGKSSWSNICQWYYDSSWVKCWLLCSVWLNLVGVPKGAGAPCRTGIYSSTSLTNTRLLSLSVRRDDLDALWKIFFFFFFFSSVQATIFFISIRSHLEHFLVLSGFFFLA